MNDLISREALIKRCMNGIDNEFIPIVQDAPTVPAIPIPKRATNGDMIISMYPNLKYSIHNNRLVTNIGVASSFDLDWWNALYKRGETE